MSTTKGFSSQGLLERYIFTVTSFIQLLPLYIIKKRAYVYASGGQ